MLHVHRSASGEMLVEALAAVLAEPLADVFTPDVVAVPAKGIERWLSQRLSHHLGSGASGDGVSANLSFPSPAALLDEALAAASPEHEAASKAWRPETSIWSLLKLIDELDASPTFAALHHYLAGGSRRYALAAKVARLFDTYGRDRPELLRDWSTGGSDVPSDLGWQPQLWRALRDELGPSPAELHEAAIAALRNSPCSLLSRISLYGVSRLTRTRLDALAALAGQLDVHLFLNHPGPALWDRVTPGPTTRAGNDSGQSIVHPLLNSLSRDVRELEQRLLLVVPDLQTRVYDGTTSAERLLDRLQRDLRADAIPDTKDPVAPADTSIQIHACHGPARQVEVLREVILQLLAADESLEPRDVLVMCPDVERYAPLVKAVFDTDSHPGGRLRVSIADRSPLQVNPLLGLASRLLELAGSRLTGPQVLDLAGQPAVRRQFGFTDDDIEQLRAWTVAANVRWGLDEQARGAWGLAGLADGTWRRGLDRLLAGVALGGGSDPFNGTLPVGGIDSTDIELVGRFAEMLDRLDAALGQLCGIAPITTWLTRLEEAVLQLGDTAWDGAWQVAQLGRELGGIREVAAGNDAPLALTDVRILLEQRLAGRPTRTSFRTGDLTVCTMTPMRSVPHRVVCLLGLDDTAFPRHGLPDGDDLLGRDPRIGERDPRSEDRQLFLDAILAAKDHLVITYTGADVRTGALLPPAVPVGELLDALDLTAEGARDHVVIRHPLQPFDPINFTPDALGAPGPFSFDRSAHAGAESLRSERTAAPPFLDAPLPQRVPGVVTLRELKDFWEHPAKAFLRQRLEVTASTRNEEPRDAISLELDNLEQWSVADRVLRARMGGVSKETAAAAERARGDLPPGEIGANLLRTINTRVDALALAARPYWGEQSSVDVDLSLADSSTLSGCVPLRSDIVLHVGYSTLGTKQRMRAWIDLLAVSASDPKPRTAVVIGRRKEDAVVERFGPVPADRARELLDELVALREIGLRTPLAMPIDAAAAYAVARREGKNSDTARDAAAEKWKSPFSFDGPDRDADHLMVWGGEVPFAALWDWTCPVALSVDVPGEITDFARLACWIWQPLLDAEVLS